MTLFSSLSHAPIRKNVNWVSPQSCVTAWLILFGAKKTDTHVLSTVKDYTKASFVVFFHFLLTAYFFLVFTNIQYIMSLDPAGELGSSSSPFPPIYSAGPLTWATPLFATPTALLVVVILFGLGRYITNTHAYPWIDADAPGSARKHLTPLARLVVAASVTVVVTFLADAFVFVTRAILDRHWTSSVLAYYIGVSWLAWVIALVCVADETHKFGVWSWVQYIFWMAAALGETTVAWLWTVAFVRPNPGTVFSTYDYAFFAVFVARYILELGIVLLCVIQMFTARHAQSAEEAAPLLTGDGNASQYGATPPVSTPRSSPNGQSGFSNFFSKMRKLMPYIWPHKSTWLQILVVVCFSLMLLGLVVNALTPLQIGRVVDSLGAGKGTFLWGAVLGYVGLRFLQGGSGLIQSMQNWLWIPIGQYTTREVSVRMFSHLHSLSLQFHINRKTGEVLRVMDRGTSSIVQLLSQILFQVLPALANILVAVVLFWFYFSPIFGVIVFVTMSLYLFVTITLTEWRTKYRRTMIELDNNARTKAVDSLLNFETVKYYGAEAFEIRRYQDAIIEYQKADWMSSSSLNILNLAQNAVISAGLLAGCLMFAWEVSEGNLSAGDFVAFNTYMMQLYAPLHFFGTYYRMIQQNFIDMEKMLALFEEQQTVQDAPGAKDIKVKEGHVVFDNVTFSYDPRQKALNGISFSIPKGATVALVGPSGGGKSTILRLLFRFYDPSAGHIYIDGQDIKQVTQESLRRNVGVVPQDTVLFNDTILYNIAYGKIDAPEDEIFNAAKAAQIHEKILSFPDGYDTKVGERGLRLSGGEKQRVAIARTILKDPPIILLDEATSALDTTTERQIQQALSAMTKDRTTLVIAHRLSTIVNADLILVIKDGRVVEQGTHEELIRQGTPMNGGPEGVYYEMWQKQLHDDSDGEQTTVGATTPLKIDTTAPLPVGPKQEPQQMIMASPTEVEAPNQVRKEEEEEDDHEEAKQGDSADGENSTNSETAPVPSDKGPLRKNSSNRKKKKKKSKSNSTVF
ncbi:hypothetical protein BX666DRAFT_1964047 [Dichotomocladium elegans]|nr:hypothetical protein BX666DRAFT_1964047 [Dichotomocladium elegans]